MSVLTSFASKEPLPLTLPFLPQGRLVPTPELDLVVGRIGLAPSGSLSLLSLMVMVATFCFTSMVSPEFFRLVPRFAGITFDIVEYLSQ